MDLTDFVIVMELFVGDTGDLEMIETSSCAFNTANGLDRFCHILMELFVRDTEDLEMIETSSCVFNKANGLDRLCHGDGIVRGRYRGSRNRWNVVLCVQQSKWTW